jgi:hypothetical protein
MCFSSPRAVFQTAGKFRTNLKILFGFTCPRLCANGVLNLFTTRAVTGFSHLRFVLSSVLGYDFLPPPLPLPLLVSSSTGCVLLGGIAFAGVLGMQDFGLAPRVADSGWPAGVAPGAPDAEDAGGKGQDKWEQGCLCGCRCGLLHNDALVHNACSCCLGVHP